MKDGSRPVRSLLFVPGNRPERFAKARDSGADAYCIDLQDAVPDTDKSLAREATIQHINQRGSDVDNGAALFIRINSLSVLDGFKDVVAIAEDLEAGASFEGILLPLASAGFEVRQLAGLLASCGTPAIIPVIETPEGMTRVHEILTASDQVCAVGFGMADYTSITGGEMGWDTLLYARSRLVEAASLRGVQTIDGPWFDIPNKNGLSEEASRVAGLGFTGKFAIHPSQVEIINRAFIPSDQKVQWAREVLRAWEEAGGGVVTVSGVMIDQPLVTRARRILSLA